MTPTSEQPSSTHDWDRGRFLRASKQARRGRILRILGVKTALVLTGVAADVAAHQIPAQPPLVFDGVTVVDVEHGILVPAQRVVITGNRIQAVGPVGQVRVPLGAQLVDARGKYMIPGLWDLHVHAAWKEDEVLHTYQLLLATGVTGIREAHSSIPLAQQVEWRREILAGTRLGPPRQVLSGLAFSDSPDPQGLAVAADRMVDSLKAAGVDMIKMYSLSRHMYFVIAAAARRAGLRFGGHVHSEFDSTSRVTVVDAARSGASIVDHAIGIGLDAFCWTWGQASVERCQSVAESFQRHNTWWVPTLNVVGPPRATPGSVAISTRLLAFSRAFSKDSVIPDVLFDSATVHAVRLSHVDSLGFLQLAHRVGLPILAGTDALSLRVPFVREVGFTGYSLHAELAMYVAEGLTPLEALRSATLNPAKMLQATDSLGTVAAGKLADLVLLDASPLDDITNTATIRAVVANGRYFDRAALDSVLNYIRENSKTP